MFDSLINECKLKEEVPWLYYQNIAKIQSLVITCTASDQVQGTIIHYLYFNRKPNWLFCSALIPLQSKWFVTMLVRPCYSFFRNSPVICHFTQKKSVSLPGPPSCYTTYPSLTVWPQQEKCPHSMGYQFQTEHLSSTFNRSAVSSDVVYGRTSVFPGCVSIVIPPSM